MKIEIYHNPRCSKSRQTLELLKSRGFEPHVRLYLEDSPSRKELEALLKKLKMKASQLIRSKEGRYKELVKKHGKPDETTALRWMVENPVLIERPVVLKGAQARLGRPPEQVLEIL